MLAFLVDKHTFTGHGTSYASELMLRCAFIIAISLCSSLAIHANDAELFGPLLDFPELDSEETDLDWLDELTNEDLTKAISSPSTKSPITIPAEVTERDGYWHTALSFLVLSRSDRTRFLFAGNNDTEQLITDSGANMGYCVSIARTLSGPADNSRQFESRYINVQGDESFYDDQGPVMYDHYVSATLRSFEASMGWVNREAHNRTFYLGPRLIRMSDKMDFLNLDNYIMWGDQLEAKNTLIGGQAGAKMAWQWRYFAIDARASWGAYHNRVQRSYSDYPNGITTHRASTFATSNEAELDLSYVPNARWRINAGLYSLLLTNVAQSRKSDLVDFYGKPVLYFGLVCGASFNY